MTAHDPLCPVSVYGPATSPESCRCGLIAQVRADESTKTCRCGCEEREAKLRADVAAAESDHMEDGKRWLLELRAMRRERDTARLTLARLRERVEWLQTEGTSLAGDEATVGRSAVLALIDEAAR